MPDVPGCARVTSQVFWKRCPHTCCRCSERFQMRDENCTWSFEFGPSESWIAVFLRASNPAFE